MRSRYWVALWQIKSFPRKHLEHNNESWILLSSCRDVTIETSLEVSSHWSDSNDLSLPRLCTHISLKIAAHAKQGSAQHWKFSKVHISPRFAHSFQISVCIRLYKKLCRWQANVIQSHEKEHVRFMQGRTRYRQTWEIWDINLAVDKLTTFHVTKLPL
jgi:hypothetical protein